MAHDANALPQRANSEIIDLSPALLTTVERQRQYVLRLALAPMPCPVCGRPTSKVEAAGYSLDEYDTTQADNRAYTCPECATALVYVVPIVGALCWATKRAHDRAVADGEVR